MQVEIYGEAEIDGRNIFKLSPNETLCDEELFRTKPYYYNGDCFALHLPRCLRELGVLELVLDFYDKADVFIHHQGQFLNPNSRSDGRLLLAK